MSAQASEVTALDATALSQQIREKRLSCTEVMHAHLAHIDRVNPRLNAVVQLEDRDKLIAEAREADDALARGEGRGWLHGLPIAIKDTAHAEGFATTFGSPILRQFMPHSDGIMVSRIRRAGAIVIGKTNVPELGLGSHTFNSLFGTTRNAWDAEVSAGGSSGGAAVALASRMLPVADGSDFMGSLRNPAGWTHVFGMRPTHGRVPFTPGPDVWLDQMVTEGPMARSARDLARLLDIQSGFDARHPWSLRDSMQLDDGWFSMLHRPDTLRGLRIGWLGDLNGHLACEDGVLAACDEALAHLASGGAHVHPAQFGVDLEALWQAWLCWRAALSGPRVSALLGAPGAQEIGVKPEALWELESYRALSFADFQRASQTRSSFFQQMLRQFEHVEVLALPVAQVWPFDVTERWPQHVNGRRMDTYHRWMECTIYATLAGAPAVSLPASFHPQRGWPMGIQLIAKPGADRLLLEIAGAYESIRGTWLAKTPQLPA